MTTQPRLSNAALLSWINRVDGSRAVLRASSEAGELRAQRLAHPSPQTRWRSGPGSYAEVYADFGRTYQVGVLACVQPHDAGGMDADGEARGWLQPGDGVRHWLDADAMGAGVLHASGGLLGGWRPGYGSHVHVLPAPVMARRWQVDFYFPSIALSPPFLDMGRLWAGPAWRPQRGNIAYDWGVAFEDGSTVSRSARAGTAFVDRAPKQRVLTFAFPSLTRGDAAEMLELQRIAGASRQVLFVPDPADGEMGGGPIVGLLDRVNPITQPNFAQFATVFQIRQSL